MTLTHINAVQGLRVREAVLGSALGQGAPFTGGEEVSLHASPDLLPRLVLRNLDGLDDERLTGVTRGLIDESLRDAVPRA